MNTAFGRPEELPFYLKQRRAITYELRKDDDKTAAQKSLRAQLRDAIRAVAEAGQRERAAAPPPVTPTKEAVDAIEASRPNQFVVAKRFVQGLTQRLVQIDAESKMPSPRHGLTRSSRG